MCREAPPHCIYIKSFPPAAGELISVTCREFFAAAAAELLQSSPHCVCVCLCLCPYGCWLCSPVPFYQAHFPFLIGKQFSMIYNRRANVSLLCLLYFFGIFSLLPLFVFLEKFEPFRGS